MKNMLLKNFLDKEHEQSEFESLRDRLTSKQEELLTAHGAAEKKKTDAEADLNAAFDGFAIGEIDLGKLEEAKRKFRVADEEFNDSAKLLFHIGERIEATKKRYYELHDEIKAAEVEVWEDIYDDLAKEVRKHINLFLKLLAAANKTGRTGLENDIEKLFYLHALFGAVSPEDRIAEITLELKRKFIGGAA